MGIDLREGDYEAVELVTLIRLNLRLLGHMARLERAEGRLRRRTPRRGAGAGRRLVEQVDLERQRLGRELHTGVGQLLAAIRIQLDMAAATLPDAVPEVRAALGRIGTLADQASGQVRAISHRLHPPEWQRLAIGDALAQLWELSGIPQKFEAELRLEPLAAEPPLAVKVLLYRAAQEALSNIVRHSGAARVEMTLSSGEGKLRLTVADDGGGFDLDRILHGEVSLRAGIGLRAIREQTQALGGEFHIRGGPGGTTLEIRLPESGDE